ncbi:hypothetical protein GGS21DRAFT_344876 [Xylaria nigripes]|nr:hypothetical protein GGS21DRAFT_344876 [Xylaria nigripes]
MNISRLHAFGYGAVLFTQASPTASSITRSRAFRAHDVCGGLIANCSYHISPHSHLAKSQWAHRRQRRLLPALTPPTGLRSPNYFTSYPPCVHRSTAESKKVTSLQDEPPVSPRGEVPHKEWNLEFVDYYDNTTVEEQLREYNDPYLRGYAPANGPNITISDRPEDVELVTIEGDKKFDDENFEPARQLHQTLLARHRRSIDVSIDTIWDLYQALPEPRPAHISARTRFSLMTALALNERKDEKSMLRYFTVMDDTKNAGFSLTTSQWNTALSFATSSVATTTVVELETALKIWRVMENEAGVKGNDVTFNILFDAASKAGKFDLAEMIYKEMAHRGYTFNRYHHVSLIHFFGLKGDSSGVRAGYKEMIEAGEIVDTVVLNCLISSFLRCGEEHSAEHVYEKMKGSTKSLRNLPHRDYNMTRAITKILLMFALVGKKHPSLLPGFQKTALQAPDLTTYRILLNYYGLQLGDLRKSVQFLDEMAQLKVPLDGAIFLVLFKSFAVHAGTGSEWTSQRLNNVWKAFLDAIDSRVEGLFIDTWLAEAILEAHARYATRNRLLDIYASLRSRWELNSERSDYMLHQLHKLLERTGLHSAKPPWKR